MAKNNDWTKPKTIVVLRTYFSIPFNNANNSNKEIITTAEIIGRSVNSVKMKIGNFGSLDPELAKRGIVGLSGTTKLDRLVWEEYNSDREKLALESTQLIAEYTNRTIEEVLEIENPLLDGRDKLTLVKSRVNQSFFRKSILGIYDEKCCISGLALPELLVASHIVPWAKDEKNRLNPENGLCLNSIHDKAFDLGFLTITTDYRVKISRAISDLDNSESIQLFFSGFDGKAISMPERYFPDKDFLSYHYKEIFIK